MTAAQEITRFSPSRQAVSQSTAIEQSRAVAEVQAQVLVAQSCPRNSGRAVREVGESCGRLAMANQAFYAVPNRGEGNSVHLLRELARAWGNIQHGSHELRRDDAEGISEVQAWAWDVETNTRTSRTFIVPHERQTRSGRNKLTDLGDIQNNNNNVAARAVRECIAAVLPKWFVEEAADHCRRTLEHGEGVPLSERIAVMVDWFGKMGVTVQQIEGRLDKPRAQWEAGDVASMKVAGNSLRAGEATKAELFPAAESSTTMEIAGYAPGGMINAPTEPVSADPSGPLGPLSADEIRAADKPKARARRTKAQIEADTARAELEAAAVAAAVAADQAEAMAAEGPGVSTEIGKPVRLPGEPASDMLREPDPIEEPKPVALVDFPAQPGDPEPAPMPEPQAGPITGTQMGKLFSLRAKMGEKYSSGLITGNKSWAELLSASTGRDVDIAKQLTDAEADIVIDTLEAQLSS